jgi:hypothetical protein
MSTAPLMATGIETVAMAADTAVAAAAAAGGLRSGIATGAAARQHRTAMAAGQAGAAGRCPRHDAQAARTNGK